MNRLISYIKNSFNEVVNHVTWPNYSDLQQSTLLVVIGSAVFGLLIFAMDSFFNWGSELLYK